MTSTVENSLQAFSEGRVSGGWKNIKIFVGNEDIYQHEHDAHLEQLAKPKEAYYTPDGRKWYSQFGQDIAVSSLLNNKKDGFFVELAANHPTFLSNTYSLEQNLNWTGLCIEPQSIHWWGLSQVRKCQLVGAVIGEKTLDKINFRVKNVDQVGGHGGKYWLRDVLYLFLPLV